MTYNQTKVNGVPMPLLMGFTKPSDIKIAEEEPNFIYDSASQFAEIECGRNVGTKCLKPSVCIKRMPSGNKYTLSDKKNEIDDSKFVL